ncbi:TetR/AcrR family transcriptional regulator [Flavobacteriaceae bacterium S356]|uniref:TetR/AcrR family transcriptional regulator n=1 Tax=Asprobacillus argus TaxID=3076534 RepID=A0ABU3LJL2_9FLAO|nr:TetR/AcrR family transcriptional regulator [Flavobacteriaceae bacterium S356]
MKHSEIKDHIIKTASHLFYHKGYNLTGINEIISEAGIAKATLYNHFKSKEDICLAYLQYKNSAFLTKIKEVCASKKKGIGQVLAVFDFLEAFFKDKDFNGCWCINTISELPKENQRIRSEIQQQKNSLINFLTELVGQNLPDHSTLEQQKLAKQIYLLYEGAVAESHLHQNDWPITSARELCNSIIN